VSVSFEPFAPAIRDDPYPAYAMLRERAPVHFAPEAGVWCVAHGRALPFPGVTKDRVMGTFVRPAEEEDWD